MNAIRLGPSRFSFFINCHLRWLLRFRALHFWGVSYPPIHIQNKGVCEINFGCWREWLLSSSYKPLLYHKKDYIGKLRANSKLKQFLPIKTSEVYFKRENQKAKYQFHLSELLPLQQISPPLSQRHKWSLWSTNYCGAAPPKSMFSPPLVQTVYHQHHHQRCFIGNWKELISTSPFSELEVTEK